MNNDVEFIDGFFAKAPHENAPEFVKAKVNIKREELLQWLTNKTDEWISVDIKEGRSGKWYASVDNWKPEESASTRDTEGESEPSWVQEDNSDSIPFDLPSPTDSRKDDDLDDVPF